jgi:hypothetical protein
MNPYGVLKLVGFGLLLLGGASGIALFCRAVVGKDKISEGPGIGTLWGLFIVCLIAEIILISIR